MNRIPLKTRIRNYAFSRPYWINGGVYERLALEAGYKASNCSRRLRELENEGILEVRRNSRGHVEYRHKMYQLQMQLSEPKEPKAVEKVEAQGALL